MKAAIFHFITNDDHRQSNIVTLLEYIQFLSRSKTVEYSRIISVSLGDLNLS
jgi:hypothetical protein